MAQEPYSALSALLQQLAKALSDAALWSAVPPSAEAMASIAPFACDSMPFEQWLQFIFLPSMQALIDENQPLPRNFALTPMGEETLNPVSAAIVLKVLADIDLLMSDPK